MKQFNLSAIFSLCIIFCLGQTQGELNNDAAKKYQQADKKLNAVYQKILKEYIKDTAFTKNLKAAQKIWIKFRDAEMNAKYPDRGNGYYGSIQPTCRYIYLTGLTEERIKDLTVWLTGIEEGDVCTGSVKIKNK